MTNIVDAVCFWLIHAYSVFCAIPNRWLGYELCELFCPSERTNAAYLYSCVGVFDKRLANEYTHLNKYMYKYVYIAVAEFSG